MLYVGCHLSSAKGYVAMGRTALEVGANTFQFFTRNPRGSRARPADPADAAVLNELCRANGFGPIVAHAPYTMNACSADPRVRTFARETMADDLRRLALLDHCLYNFHPGSHVGQGIAAGISLVVEALDDVLRPEQKTVVLLETMAGKGSEVGSRFEELREILDRVAVSDKLGVCLDTCHVSDAGYDLAADPDAVLTEFDRVIGLDRLRAVHMNDSLYPAGSHRDRHARLGEGMLGLDTFLRLRSHPALRGLPLILETPNELPGYAREIRLLRS